MSENGTVVAIGAHMNDGNGFESGHVRVYAFVGDDWSKIRNDLDGRSAGDWFGYSVALSLDGAVVASGASSGWEGGGTLWGYVQVHRLVSGNWVKIGDDIEAESAGDGFGSAVSLSKDGTIVAVSAPFSDKNGEESGQGRVFQAMQP